MYSLHFYSTQIMLYVIQSVRFTYFSLHSGLPHFSPNICNVRLINQLFMRSQLFNIAMRGRKGLCERAKQIMLFQGNTHATEDLEHWNNGATRIGNSKGMAMTMSCLSLNSCLNYTIGGIITSTGSRDCKSHKVLLLSTTTAQRE